MPRPHKRRMVCSLPNPNRFGPKGQRQGNTPIIQMTVEEFETLRLIDVEGMTQEECAQTMGVARTTVQKIYNDARRKLGEMLVYGRNLVIDGGVFQLCDGLGKQVGCGRHCRHRSGSDDTTGPSQTSTREQMETGGWKDENGYSR